MPPAPISLSCICSTLPKYSFPDLFPSICQRWKRFGFCSVRVAQQRNGRSLWWTQPVPARRALPHALLQLCCTQTYPRSSHASVSCSNGFVSTTRVCFCHSSLQPASLHAAWSQERLAATASHQTWWSPCSGPGQSRTLLITDSTNSQESVTCDLGRFFWRYFLDTKALILLSIKSPTKG